MKNLKDSNVFLKFIDADGEDRFVSVNDILISGNPIDDDAVGNDFEQADDLVYLKKDGTFVAIRA